MRGAIPPLPNMPSWRGAQLRHRDNFTLLYFTLLYFTLLYEGVSKSFWTESITKYTLTTINTR
jgi:hypothetical protein